MKKRITLVSAVYPPEPVISSQTSASLALALAANGDDVTVITAFPNRPAGKLFPGYKRRLYLRESSADGSKIIRCFATFSPSSSLLSRFLENISFGLSAGCALLILPRPDVIYANTWPIFATGILMLIARLRNIPVVLSIQDVYPESLIAQGRINLTSSWVKLLRNIDTWISHQAQRLILISERFTKIYRESRHVDSEKIVVVPNWGDETFLTKQDQGADIRKMYAIDNEELLIVYGGNIGVGADIETVIRALGLISAERQVRLLIAGSGSQFSACHNLANRVAPDKVLFHTPWQTEETSTVLTAANIFIMPTLGEQSDVSVPSKLINYMFSGRPTIALVNEDSETAEVIRMANCGWILPPGQSKPLGILIDEISKLPEEALAELGESGRQYALECFSSSVNIPKVLDALYANA